MMMKGTDAGVIGVVVQEEGQVVVEKRFNHSVMRSIEPNVLLMLISSTCSLVKMEERRQGEAEEDEEQDEDCAIFCRDALWTSGGTV